MRPSSFLSAKTSDRHKAKDQTITPGSIRLQQLHHHWGLPLLQGILLIALMTASETVHAKSLAKLGYPDLMLVGQSRLSVLFWDIYDIGLYAPGGIYESVKPFALSLSYLRDVSGPDITKWSLEEMQKQGADNESNLAAWKTELNRIFRDVAKGDELIGISHSYDEAQFFLNGVSIGTMTDQVLIRRFFEIWLSEKTSRPEIRESLMGIDRQ